MSWSSVSVARSIGIATLWNLAEPEIAGHAVFGLLNADYEVYRDGACPMCIAGSHARTGAVLAIVDRARHADVPLTIADLTDLPT